MKSNSYLSCILLGIKCIKCSNPISKNEISNQYKISNPYICPICMLSSFDPWTKHISSICKLFPLLHSLNPTKISFNYIQNKEEDFLIIRCLKISSSGYSLDWPKNSQIILNNKTLIENSNNVFKKKSKGIAIFSLKKKIGLKKTNIFDFKQFIEQKNHLTISSRNSDSSIYFISIDTIKSNDSIQDIIKEAKIFNEINAIKGLVGINNEIKIASEKIDLIDVYTGINKVKIPVRGINCIHLSIFDLKTFLLFTKKSKKSVCPICNKLTGEVYIDGIIYEKIKKIPNLVGLISDNEYNFIEEIIGEETNEKSIPYIRPDVETIIINDDENEDNIKEKTSYYENSLSDTEDSKEHSQFLSKKRNREEKEDKIIV